MRKVLSVVAGLLFLTALLHAANNQKTLTNNQLDAITAGDATASGAIVVNNSAADIEKEGTVRIHDGAQTDIKAVNLINSVSSQVAAGTNIFTFKNGDNKNELEFHDLYQTNRIDQSFGEGAELNDYERGHEVFVKGFEFEAKRCDSCSSLEIEFDKLAVLGPVEFEEAEAEFIVADGSKLKYEEEYSVDVGAGAQSKISAVNVVNAAHSLVGMGLNLTVLSSEVEFHNLNQTNTIYQH